MKEVQTEFKRSFKGVSRMFQAFRVVQGRLRDVPRYLQDSFSDKVGHEVTKCEKNPNQYFLGTSLPY